MNENISIISLKGKENYRDWFTSLRAFLRMKRVHRVVAEEGAIRLPDPPHNASEEEKQTVKDK